MEGRKRGNFCRPLKPERPQERNQPEIFFGAIDSYVVSCGRVSAMYDWVACVSGLRTRYTNIPHGLKTIRTSRNELE